MKKIDSVYKLLYGIKPPYRKLYKKVAACFPPFVAMFFWPLVFYSYSNELPYFEPSVVAATFATFLYGCERFRQRQRKKR